MLTKNELKYYQSLLQKKIRKEENKFFVEGKRIVDEGLRSEFKCEIIFLSSSFSKNNPNIVNELLKFNSQIEVLKEQDFEKISETKHSQGIAAVFHKKQLEKNLPGHSNLMVALENISDPGNAGTIIRNCDWFGIKELILGENCVESYNPKVLRASMGSVFHLEISEAQYLIDTLKELKEKGYSIICTDMKGESIFKYRLGKKSVIIFSSEANGPSKEVLNIAETKITIPQIGNAESLNVASASAVILAEFTKSK